MSVERKGDLSHLVSAEFRHVALEESDNRGVSQVAIAAVSVSESIAQIGSEEMTASQRTLSGVPGPHGTILGHRLPQSMPQAALARLSKFVINHMVRFLCGAA